MRLYRDEALDFTLGGIDAEAKLTEVFTPSPLTREGENNELRQPELGFHPRGKFPNRVIRFWRSTRHELEHLLHFPEHMALARDPGVLSWAQRLITLVRSCCTTCFPAEGST